MDIQVPGVDGPSGIAGVVAVGIGSLLLLVRQLQGLRVNNANDNAQVNMIANLQAERDAAVKRADEAVKQRDDAMGMLTGLQLQIGQLQTKVEQLTAEVASLHASTASAATA